MKHKLVIKFNDVNSINTNLKESYVFNNELDAEDYFFKQFGYYNIYFDQDAEYVKIKNAGVYGVLTGICFWTVDLS